MQRHMGPGLRLAIIDFEPPDALPVGAFQTHGDMLLGIPFVEFLDPVVRHAEKHRIEDRRIEGVIAGIVALLMLTRVRALRLCDYDALLAFVRKNIVGGDVLFLPSLNFLFLLGLIEYHPKTDAIEYVGQNEAV